MAELADAPDSGSGARKGVRVRLPPPALSLAGVAELADAPDLGSGARKGVRVRLPPPAPLNNDVYRL